MPAQDVRPSLCAPDATTTVPPLAHLVSTSPAERTSAKVFADVVLSNPFMSTRATSLPHEGDTAHSDTYLYAFELFGNLLPKGRNYIDHRDERENVCITFNASIWF